MTLTDDELIHRLEILMRERETWAARLSKYELMLFNLYYEQSLTFSGITTRLIESGLPSDASLVEDSFLKARKRLDKEDRIAECRKNGEVLPLDFWLSKRSVNELRNKNITSFRQFAAMTKMEAQRVTRYGHVSAEFGTILGAMKQMGLKFKKK